MFAIPPGPSVQRMAGDNTLRIYSEHAMRKRAVAGRHNFLNLVSEVAETAGMSVEHHLARPADLLAATDANGYALTHMKPPPHARALVFRRVYHYPFWQIDRRAERWEWDVARASFDPDTIDPGEAKPFARNWRHRLFGSVEARDDGFVYIPLQGRLLEKRSFQSCAPLDMIVKVRAAFPERRIVATLHPNETYSQLERQALDALSGSDPGIEVRTGGMDALLPSCHCVVTMNSAVAFSGFFFEKPAVLFAKIDFHHIALDGATGSPFDHLPDHQPNYAAYLYWFWQIQAINAGRPDARDRIAARLRELGWPV